MAANVDKTSVINGVLSPSKADVDKIVARLQAEIKSNPKVAAQFKANPRATLGAFGLNEDVQHELLRDMGVAAAASICVFTDCIHTCWFTKCYVTHIVITKE
jgi:hypothetical protein